MGHEYCGAVVEVGSEVRTVKPGQFVVGSFCLSYNACPHCKYGFQSCCEHREFMTSAQAPYRPTRVETLRSNARHSGRQHHPLSFPEAVGLLFERSRPERARISVVQVRTRSSGKQTHFIP